MPEATVMIATYNRREEVARAVRSALDQTVDVEVLVTDDASTDGTAGHLAEQFGDAVTVVRSETSKRSLVHRNAMARAAAGPVLISLDDDAELTSPRIVEQVLAEFDHPRIAAVGIPFFDAPRPTRLEHRAPPGAGRVITDYFLGCCAALDRDKFNAVGGYAPSLQHSGEEPDLCARWFARGWVVRLGTADLAIHHVSPKRTSAFAVRYATRNEWRNALVHVPSRQLPRALGRLTAVAAARTVVRREPKAVVEGVRDALVDRDPREPLGDEAYAIWQQLAEERLKRTPTTTLDEVEARLPPAAA